MTTVQQFRHKGEELDAIKHPYNKGVQCLKWAEACRDRWYEEKLDAGLHRGVNGEFEWSKSVMARDLVGLEQMYHRWATTYFAQTTAWHATKPS